MFFTREDILKIQQALLQLGVKDSELPNAEPVTYNDTLSIVQDGKNKQIGVKDFFNQISLWKREDFLNITDKYDEHYIMLLEAINLVPILQRKDGLVITFQDTNGDWRVYQFRGNITEFLNEEKWFDLYDYRNYIIKSFLPDEEDITALTPDENGNSFLALKDRIYDPAIFSGKGYKFVRKNIINIELATIKISITNPTTLEGDIYFNINNKGTKVHLSPTIHNTTKLVSEAIKDALVTVYNDYKVTVTNSVVTLTHKYSGNTSPTTFEMYNTGVKVIVEDTTIIEERNVIIQEDINEEDTIYEIRYDFDLDGKTITIPNNCVLYFTSGKFYNGSINMDNTIVSTLYEDVLSEVNISGNYYNIQKHIKDHQSQLDDKQAQIDDKQQQITANDEDISLLQTRSTQMEETIKSIAATGGASQATAVTYNNDSSRLNAVNAQAAIDEVSSIVIYDVSARNGGVVFESLQSLLSSDNLSTLIPTAVRYGGMSIRFVQSSDNKYVQYRLMSNEWSADTNDWSFCGDDVLIENPEWIYVLLDAKNRILAGIKSDGSVEWAIGIPTPVKTCINNAIAEIKNGTENTDLDGLNKIISFLSNFSTSDILKDLLDAKVDKEEGKSLIDAEYADGVYYTENPEFIYVKTDAKGKILWAIKTDGSIYYGAGCPQQVKVMIDDINAQIESLDENKINKEGMDVDALKTVSVIENPEYIDAITDSEGKLLAGRTPDGAAFENVGLFTPKVSIDGHTIENIEDPEERREITIDSEGKIISYRDADGVLHENVGIKSNAISLSEEGLKEFQENLNTVPINKKRYLPKFGKINIKEETFYLTADSRWSTKDDVVCIQMYDDTNENASQKLTLSYYYIKSTLTPLASGGYDRTSVNENSVRLDFYIAKDIKEVSGSYYVKSTLVDSQVVPESIEVTQVKDVPPYKAWVVNKKPEHYCLADIDFGEFYSKKNVPISIKYQGNSTMGNRKRGFRITFYKNNDYAKKDKVKIGEMVRLSGYNMKSYFYDNSRIKDPFISNVVIEMLDSRGKEAYPWNADSVPFNGATGTIKSFPIETWFGSEFFGLQFFGLKKDERNYMLDGNDDSSGIFAQGYGYGMFTNMSVRNWEDQMAVDGREKAFPEMEDSVSVETAAAIEKLLKATKGLVDGTIEIEGQTVNFDISMLEEHIDVESWIDYWIVCEVFQLWDSTSNNMIIHTRRDKKKFYGFFYDLDQSFGLATDKSIIEAIGSDGDFWDKFRKEYKDLVINRYYSLRKSVLSEHNLDSLYHTIVDGIPSDIISKEVERWGNGNPASFTDMLSKLKERLVWLDETYFNLK